MLSNEERCLYAKAPLIEVICQLRFPTILKIENQDPYDFQERIRADYPNYSVKEERNAQQDGSAATTKNHQFVSLDGGWKVNLTKDFVSLSTRRYTRWEDFAKRLDRVLASLINIYRPACFNRVGLRYMNAFNPRLLSLEGTPWRELITPGYLGLMADEEVPENAFAKNEQNVNVSLPGGCRANLKSGKGMLRKVDNKTRAVADEPVYMLDIDVYMEGQNQLNHVAPALNVLHGNADSLFRGAVTETLHDAMEPQSL